MPDFLPGAGARAILSALSCRPVRRLLGQLSMRLLRVLPPADGLRLLFGLDTALYRFEGILATAYDGGIHTKHRHMRYHDFFVTRIRQGERVLDVGCGNGAVSYDVAEKAGARVIGIDLNEENISLALARHNHPNIEYRVGDARSELGDEAFDVIILSNLLEHLPSRADFLRTLCLKARPERFLIRVPLFERDWRVPLKQELGMEWRLDPTHETEYTLESFSEEMAAAGLKITHHEVRWGEIWAEVVRDAGP